MTDYPMQCDTCGTIGTEDDGIEIGGPCQDETCTGLIISTAMTAEEFVEGVIDAYREWTNPNGWDINIMSDIAGLLVKGGWVDENDPIITPEEG